MSRKFLIKKGILPVLAVGALGLVAVGCGGGQDETTTAAQITIKRGSLPKAQFIKQADAICTTGREEWEKAFRNFLRNNNNANEVSKSEELALAKVAVSGVLEPVFKKEIARIRALGAPAGDEERVGAILTGIQQGLEEGVSSPINFIRTTKSLDRATKLSNAYGFTACGRP
jgi:hypothetical protein